MAYYKKKIWAALRNKHKINLRNAKKAISDFRKISSKPEHIIEMMVFYVEVGIEIENEFGDMYEAFYASMESVFEAIVNSLNANPEFIPLYHERLSKIVDKSSDAWAHKDSLSEILDDLNTKDV